MAEMVWCQSCKKVVWAYDHQESVDLRGICNMLSLPCPRCGEQGNFDGWGSKNVLDARLIESAKRHGSKIYDMWSAMAYVAECQGVEWEPSGNNHWFPERLNDTISKIIRGA